MKRKITLESLNKRVTRLEKLNREESFSVYKFENIFDNQAGKLIPKYTLSVNGFTFPKGKRLEEHHAGLFSFPSDEEINENIFFRRWGNDLAGRWHKKEKYLEIVGFY